METVYRLIDAALMRFGSGFYPHCHHFGWCNFVWNAGRESSS